MLALILSVSVNRCRKAIRFLEQSVERQVHAVPDEPWNPGAPPPNVYYLERILIRRLGIVGGVQAIRIFDRVHFIGHWIEWHRNMLML